MNATRTGGFTLIEIMMVVVIIGILAALIIPNVVGRDDQARVTAAKSDLNGIANALNMYKLDNFHYPSTDQGLEALVTQPSGFPEAKNWNPNGYLKKAPGDPWGTPYVYIATSDGFELYSLGSDGVEGGERYSADIHYEPK
jgi:general secretion pathway protein G